MKTSKTHLLTLRGVTRVALGAGLLTGVLLQAQQPIVIPADHAYPAGSGDAARRGFVGKVHVARQSQSFNASIGRANAQLRGELIDNTLNPPAPYLNLVQTPEHPDPFDPNPVAADGTFTNTTVINYSINAAPPNEPLEEGLFNSFTGHPDRRYPGLPGWTDDSYSVTGNVNAFAWEEITWLELPQGLITIGANAYDAVQIAIHRNDPRDLFRQPVVWFDSNAGLAVRKAVLEVQQAGVYGFRIVHTVFGGVSAQVEFFTADAEDTQRSLVNDADDAAAVKAFRSLTVPPRPYVDSVSPGIAASGVAENAPIEVVLVNLGAHTSVLKVNNSPVTFSSSTQGNRTTLTYNPPGGWGGGRTVNVTVEYAGAVGSWSFQTRTGQKALVVGLSAGDTLIAQRLASQFGMDVDNLPEGTVSANSANNPDLEAGKAFLMQYKLIWNSEAVSSGSARPYINFLRNNDLPIPAVNVEQANVADWPLGSGGSQVAGNVYTSIIITDPASPFAAGLSGTVQIVKDGVTSGTWHAPSAVPEYAFGLLGTALNEVTPAVYGVLAGTDTGSYVHPTRRVQMAIAGPGMVANWNENGWAIFDAAIRWVLNLPDEPPRFNPVTREGNDVILSWTGGGTLQEASAVTGVWADAANQANPQRVPATGTKFFRLRR